jgi:hypothetical protein
MKKLKLVTHTEADMAVTRFTWQTDLENNAIISWAWPKNEDVKYLLAASTTESPEDPLQWLLHDPTRHSVIPRNLSAHYEVPIGNEPKRFIFAPAYLKGKEVAVYGPVCMTDLLYARTQVEVKIKNQALPFSLFKRIYFTLHYADDHGMGIGKNALRYALYEYNRLIGEYPLDTEIITNGYLYVKKTQHIQFMIEPTYAHLIALV